MAMLNNQRVITFYNGIIMDNGMMDSHNRHNHEYWWWMVMNDYLWVWK